MKTTERSYKSIRIQVLTGRDAIEICFYGEEGLIRSFEMDGIYFAMHSHEMQRKLLMPLPRFQNGYTQLVDGHDIEVVKSDKQWINSIFLGQIGRPRVINR